MKLPAWLYRLRPLLGVVILIAGWALIHAAGAVDPVLLPSPAEAASAFWNGMTQGTLGADFGKTIVRTLSSFAIALVVAVPLGIVLGASQRLYESIEFAIDFFRSTPASAMFPLFLVIFGAGEQTKIAVAAFGAALVILFNVAYGVMGAAKAGAFGIAPLICIVMGTLTACFGGVVRDTLAGQPSILLRREINVTAAILAATVYMVLRAPGVGVWPAAIVAALSGLLLRAAALRWGWTLPGFPTHARRV